MKVNVYMFISVWRHWQKCMYVCMYVHVRKCVRIVQSKGLVTLKHIDLRPSRQSRNRCIRSTISRYNLDRWRVEFRAIATPTGSRWPSNNYITRWHNLSQLDGVRVAVRGSENQLPAEGLWLRTPGWAAQKNEKRSAAIVRWTVAQYAAVCSVSNSHLTHNPFA